MKILQINASYKPAYIYGGPTMSVAKLSESLAKAGCTVQVFTTTANGTTELPVIPGSSATVDGVPVRYFKRITKDHTHFSPSLLLTLWKEVKNFDLLHIHAWWNLVSVLSALIGLLRGVPVLLSPRGTLSNYSFTNRNSISKRLIHLFLGKHILKNSHIHVTSQRELHAINKIISPRSITIVPNFVQLPTASTIISSKNEVFKLIFLSRIEEKKGLDLLFQALSTVTVPYHLDIAGDGEPAYVNHLKALADHYKITEKISWLGFQHSDKFSLLQQHDLLVLPSHDENFGNVVIESLSVGTPVLISEHVGLADYVINKQLGWVCELSVTAFSNAINHIAEENEQLAIIRNTAPQIIKTDFKEDQLIHKYLNLYHKLIKGD